VVQDRLRELERREGRTDDERYDDLLDEDTDIDHANAFPPLSALRVFAVWAWIIVLVFPPLFDYR
jgi:hypothetical protein